ncbi:MAG: VOC family protein [Chloroflexi bacterium]|nr:VOC family protein [Chloroflexota bacterium]
MDAAPPPELRLQPLVHVEDMPRAVRLYELLGGRVADGSREGDWVLMDVAGGQLGLLAHPPNPAQHTETVELNFVADSPLEEVETRLRRAGAEIVERTSETTFGRQLLLRTPDGLLVKINELHPGRYA